MCIEQLKLTPTPLDFKSLLVASGAEFSGPYNRCTTLAEAVKRFREVYRRIVGHATHLIAVINPTNQRWMQLSFVYLNNACSADSLEV
jgi:hypothetical protein